MKTKKTPRLRRTVEVTVPAIPARGGHVGINRASIWEEILAAEHAIRQARDVVKEKDGNMSLLSVFLQDARFAVEKAEEALRVRPAIGYGGTLG